MLKKIIKFFKISLAAAAIMALTAAAAYFALGSEYAGRKVSRILSEYSGGEISVKNLSGSYLSDASLNRFKMCPKEVEPERSGVKSFRADSISAGYSFLSMLKNRKIGLRSFDLKNVRIDIAPGSAAGGISFAGLLDSAKIAIAGLFYNPAAPFFINKININELRLVFESLNKPNESAFNFSRLKIFPKNTFMNSYYFESLIEMLHGGAVIIPSCGIKGDIDLNAMTMKIYFEAERVKLSDFGWLANYAAPGCAIEDGVLLASAVLNYSQQEGLQIFGNAVVKNLVIKTPQSPYKLTGDLLNINFNEDSIKLIKSKVSFEEIAMIVDGTISDIFSRGDVKVNLSVKAENNSAEKYFAAAKKYFGGELVNAYYSTGAIDVESLINGIGSDYSRWEHKTVIAFKNVDIVSQKLSLAFERINGRIEGDASEFKFRGPFIMKTAGRWQELSGEIKNYQQQTKMTYGINFKEYEPSFHNENITITEDAGYFIAFDYDEGDESWGGAVAENSPAVSLKVSASKSAKGRFYSAAGGFRDIEIDGLFGLRRSKISAALSARNTTAALSGLVISNPGGTFYGDLKMSFSGDCPQYSLNLKPCADENGPQKKDALNLSGALSGIGEDLKTLFKFDTAHDPPSDGIIRM
ncbi:MAG: hypothetical protein A2008_11485 [Candidatus Wallbacteria bacterium GWC2_49_35]|uniref:AsmA-like C-terminal domain-containing protein n=1 Tax=Candidatus Wallbacteria bacterium GWC2_49_35 TaxID=1817813 RepID=A0A1F7WG98_9BACT|nr:MAG: hypothetical protein A2008_11485 [Candidatus Wallbacteria bacterium GWC2_49_35]HBC74975.1 hypothetical protein [Candidatus Wallbacteria bacterium]